MPLPPPHPPLQAKEIRAMIDLVRRLRAQRADSGNIEQTFEDFVVMLVEHVGQDEADRILTECFCRLIDGK